MLIITVEVDAPGRHAMGIKEDLAMYLERYGDCKVKEVREILPEQLKLGGAQET